MKKLSEQLLEMSKGTAALEGRVAARNQQNREEFEAEVAEARKSAQAAQAALAARLDSIHESMSSQWHEVQQSFNNQVVSARSKVAARKAAHDLAVAQEHADVDEEYAQVATDFAQWAAAEANAAIIQANQSLAYAKSLETATPSPVATS